MSYGAICTRPIKRWTRDERVMLDCCGIGLGNVIDSSDLVKKIWRLECWMGILYRSGLSMLIVLQITSAKVESVRLTSRFKNFPLFSFIVAHFPGGKYIVLVAGVQSL